MLWMARRAVCLACVLALIASVWLARPAWAAPGAQTQPAAKAVGNQPDPKAKEAQLREALGKLPYRIVFESYRDKSWDLYAINADGSGEKAVAREPKIDELYPHASPDGSKIVFEADVGGGRERVRNVYLINADGSGLKLVAGNAREPCWNHDGRRIAYAEGEFDRFTTSSYGTRGLYCYDVAAGTSRKHSNTSIMHVSYLCWSPDDKWIFATVHGGMGYAHADLAIEAEGNRVAQIENIDGCRIDVTPDGKKILWNADDQSIVAGDLDLSSAPPKVTNIRTVVYCERDRKMYHGDWSPCGKYIAFSSGPEEGSQHVGETARGWQICVADASQQNVWVTLTSKGEGNKEPDWMVVKKEDGK